mmetsp:Transcript_35947/g.70742  ORF Transcript_35947/g.70742 Transcript_35947/m.70742 type:complete len:99 (-) Transcript_35947:268-564(-)
MLPCSDIVRRIFNVLHPAVFRKKFFDVICCIGRDVAAERGSLLKNELIQCPILACISRVPTEPRVRNQTRNICCALGRTVLGSIHVFLTPSSQNKKPQ